MYVTTTLKTVVEARRYCGRAFDFVIKSKVKSGRTDRQTRVIRLMALEQSDSRRGMTVRTIEMKLKRD